MKFLKKVTEGQFQICKYVADIKQCDAKLHNLINNKLNYLINKIVFLTVFTALICFTF